MKEESKAMCQESCRSVVGWRGYTIDELEQRRAINAVKCDLVKEQIAFVYKGIAAPTGAENGDSPIGLRLSRIMSYVSYGMQFFRYARSISSLWRDLRASFSSASPRP